MAGTAAFTAEQPGIRANKRLIVPLIVLNIGFAAICTITLAETRRVTFERAGEVANRLATAIASDVARNLEALELSMQAVIDNVNRPEVLALSPKLQRLILFDRSASAHHLGSVLILDERGNITMSSRTAEPAKVNLFNRDYFQIHRESPDAGTFIGYPILSRLTGGMFVTVSRRLSHADGTFAGVVVGGILVSSFETLFKNATIGPGSAVMLSRSDGILLAGSLSNSDYAGLEIGNAELFDRVKREPSGSFVATSPHDDPRLIAYSRAGNFPLVVSVGQSTAEIFRRWNRDALTIGLLVAALCLIGITLATRLFGELARRGRAEAMLARLAAVDPLTGLYNRRHFDHALDREWRRGARSGAPLSLLMIDLDRFKGYNDRYGHQAGDALLQTMAESIGGSVKRGGDIGARLGGDEFAVLLPDADLDDAAKIANELHRRFMAACAEYGEATGLSIGVACRNPVEGGTFAELVADADGALYGAKRRGRNCIEVCESGHTRRPLAKARRVA